MKRDGASKSIWQEGMKDYQPVNSWNKDDIYDVLIVGGGITGLTTALLLQTAGKKCALAEAHNIGFGSTGGTTAHLNTILDTTYDVIEKNFSKESAKVVASGTREAIHLVEQLVKQYNIGCDFVYEPSFIFSTTDEQSGQLEKIVAAAVRANVDADFTEEFSASFSHQKACRFESQARLHISRYLYGLALAFEKNGGILLQQCIVNKVEEKGHFSADTSLGTIQANKIVYATHIPPGTNILHFRNAPYRSYVQAFTLKNGDYPRGLIYDMNDPYNYYRTQMINGKEYIIAGGFDHKTGHNHNTEEVFVEQEAFLRKHFDIDTIDFKWSSQYYTPVDGLPYIGLLPGENRIYTATGFGGNGITYGSLAGKIISDLIIKTVSPYEKLFDPNRIKPVAGFKEFVKEGADVISQYISLQFSYKKIKELAQIAPGEAMLAEWEGKKLALYKDENGDLHVLDPICPHEKCLVVWNNAEKSWDCPCHGSRFGCNGALLTGPAKKDLFQIIWEDIEGD